MVQKVRLIPDRRHLRDIGQLVDGRNFWIDVQLCTEGQDTRDFVATYIFDESGNLSSHEIKDLGLRSDPARLSAKEIVAEELHRLEVKRSIFSRSKRSDFWVRPFSVQAYGLEFGLVVREKDEENTEGSELVDAMPGSTQLFYPPWADGLYDT